MRLSCVHPETDRRCDLATLPQIMLYTSRQGYSHVAADDGRNLSLLAR